MAPLCGVKAKNWMSVTQLESLEDAEINPSLKRRRAASDV